MKAFAALFFVWAAFTFIEWVFFERYERKGKKSPHSRKGR